MIKYKIWEVRKKNKNSSGRLSNYYFLVQDGWFLFGIVPIYVRDKSVRNPK